MRVFKFLPTHATNFWELR